MSEAAIKGNINHQLCKKDMVYLTLSKPASVPSGSDTSSGSLSSGSTLLTSLALVARFLSTLDFVIAFEAAATTSFDLEGFKLALALLRTFLKLSRVCCFPVAAFLFVLGAISSLC